jgi:hypothetical protein
MTWLFFYFLGKIPTAFWLLITAAGVVGFFSAGILSKIAPLKTMSFAIQPLSVLIAVFGIYMFGGASINDHYLEKIKEMQAKVEIAEAKSSAVNTVIEERIQTQTQVIRNNQIVYQDRIVEITPEINAQCVLPEDVSIIHNDAATFPFAPQLNQAARGERK